MTALEFWMEFCNIFSDDDFLVKAKKCWKKRADFTKCILPKISEAMSQEKYGFNKENREAETYEYYRIDLIGWKDKKEQLSDLQKINGYNLTQHLWSLEVAVEHENDQFDWTDELVKLLYINCPLRVVIGYYPEHLSHEELLKVASYASGVVLRAEEKNVLIGSSQEYMLILGKNHSDENELSANTYFPFVYNSEAKQFEPVDQLK